MKKSISEKVFKGIANYYREMMYISICMLHEQPHVSYTIYSGHLLESTQRSSHMLIREYLPK